MLHKLSLIDSMICAYSQITDKNDCPGVCQGFSSAVQDLNSELVELV
jgi:hypothetical protein